MKTIHEERLKNWIPHPSMRGQFAYHLYKAMAEDDRIFLLQYLAQGRVQLLMK